MGTGVLTESPAPGALPDSPPPARASARGKNGRTAYPSEDPATRNDPPWFRQPRGGGVNALDTAAASPADLNGTPHPAVEVVDLADASHLARADASRTAARDASTAGPRDASEGDEGGEKRASQATVLVRLARERFRLVTGDDGRPYAVAKTGPAMARPLRGTNGLRRHLARLYADTTRGTAPAQAALADALTVLEGYAADCDPEPVYLRVAPYRAGVVLDLGTVDGRCVLVDPRGWTVTSRAPVLFRRTNLTSPLAEPLPRRGPGATARPDQHRCGSAAAAGRVAAGRAAARHRAPDPGHLR